MNNKLFIGGINYKTSEKELSEVLSEFGKVMSLRIITDRETGVSKGFGFATMEDSKQAENAIRNLDNTVLDGRRIGVKPQIDK